MNLSIAKEIRSEIEAAVEKIAKKYKMNLDLGNGTFTAENFAVRVKLVEPTKPAGKVVPSKGTTATKNLMYGCLGLSDDVVGTTFKHKTKTFTVSKIDVRKPKNCVILEDQNGKQFKCSVDMFKRMAGK